MVRFWFQRFRSGNFDLQNQPRGRPETKVKNEELKAIVEDDSSQSTSEIAAGERVYNVNNKDEAENVARQKDKELNTSELFNLDNASELYNDFMKNYKKNYTKKRDRATHFYRFVKTLVEINKNNFNGNTTLALDENADAIKEPNDFEFKEDENYDYDEDEETSLDEKGPIYEFKDAPMLFEKFMKDYNKEYKDKKERDKHYQNFLSNLKYINEVNSESGSFTSDINMFSDLADDELGAIG
nr:putative uncharacterized protein DDB_G0267716 [Vanessa tameamea]